MPSRILLLSVNGAAATQSRQALSEGSLDEPEARPQRGRLRGLLGRS
ncbi:hypothetical protein BH24CHL5_BH24CHL5_01980 [soil metagenome]